MDACTPLSRRRDSGDGRRYDTSLISIPDVAILLISINGLLPASPDKGQLLTSLRQQGVWEREGMVWLCACLRYGHDVWCVVSRLVLDAYVRARLPEILGQYWDTMVGIHQWHKKVPRRFYALYLFPPVEQRTIIAVKSKSLKSIFLATTNDSTYLLGVFLLPAWLFSRSVAI